MQRYGRVVHVKPEMLETYKKLHANPWPQVTAAIHESNIRNFSIHVFGELLFSYFEYVGTDFDADMARLDAQTADWLRETDACQRPLQGARPGELWSIMDEVFFQE